MCLGRTALDKAISEGHSETAEVLRENGKSYSCLSLSCCRKHVFFLIFCFRSNTLNPK